jgi:hypothetical protein
MPRMSSADLLRWARCVPNRVYQTQREVFRDKVYRQLPSVDAFLVRFRGESQQNIQARIEQLLLTSTLSDADLAMLAAFVHHCYDSLAKTSRTVEETPLASYVSPEDSANGGSSTTNYLAFLMTRQRVRASGLSTTQVPPGMYVVPLRQDLLVDLRDLRVTQRQLFEGTTYGIDCRPVRLLQEKSTEEDAARESDAAYAPFYKLRRTLEKRESKLVRETEADDLVCASPFVMARVTIDGMAAHHSLPLPHAIAAHAWTPVSVSSADDLYDAVAWRARKEAEGTSAGVPAAEKQKTLLDTILETQAAPTKAAVSTRPTVSDLMRDLDL